jgi:hypothetical protein
MFSIKQTTLALTATVLLSSCGSDFLDVDNFQAVEDSEAILSADDVTTAMTGVYYWMGSTNFYGRSVPAIGDLASDNATHTGKTSHYYSFYAHTYQATTAYLSNTWQVGYKIADYSTRIIERGTALLADADAYDASVISSGLSQAYAARGLASFVMANLYALPYSPANLDKQGIVLLTKHVEAFETVGRATVGETYEYILEQFEQAAAYAESAADISNAQGYLNPVAITALQARVNLYMGRYAEAKGFAQAAIDAAGGTIALTESDYNNLFAGTSLTAEDIFVVRKSNDDNLSANSLNTLYNTYGAGASDDLLALYDSTDIRRQLVEPWQSATVWGGGKFAEAITNVPVVRLPEMYLILAECEAELGNAEAAAEALFAVARRNTAITSAADLPTSTDELLSFIVDERRRELFQEGHRLFDVRRRGESILVCDGSLRFDNGQIVFPIPNDEINSGSGVEQTADWSSYRPYKPE